MSSEEEVLGAGVPFTIGVPYSSSQQAIVQITVGYLQHHGTVQHGQLQWDPRKEHFILYKYFFVCHVKS